MMKTLAGKELFVNHLLPATRGVVIGEHEISLEEFCSIAAHILGGGLFGWGEGVETPEPVNKALDYLFRMYRPKGKWVRTLNLKPKGKRQAR